MILNNLEVNILAFIELIDAYNKQYSENFINENVIYCIHNKINGKNYIGQTTNFKNRYSDSYIGHFKDYHKYTEGTLIGEKILYAAWKKYGLESFIVYIIDIGKDRSELNEREIFWIKKLHTCTKDPNCHGYNLTWGGEDVNLASERSIKKSLATRLEKYGSYVSPACHTPEAFAKGNKTKKEKYGHAGFINAFTPEANEKRKQTNLKRYGTTYGPKASKEAINKMVSENIKKYGDPMGACNLDPKKRIKNTKISNCFKSIYNNQSVSKSINLEQYVLILITRTSTTKGRNQLLNIKELLSDLRSDTRWNQDLEMIFKDLEKKSIEEIKDLVNTIAKNKALVNINIAVKQRDLRLKIDRGFELVNNFSSWISLGNSVIESCGRHLGRAKEKLINLINLIPELKKDPRWTSELEMIFGDLGEKEIHKIESLGRRNKKL